MAQIVTKQSDTNNQYYTLDLKNKNNAKIVSHLDIIKVLDTQHAIVRLNQPAFGINFNLRPVVNNNWKWYATTPIENIDYPLTIYIYTKNKSILIKHIDNKKELFTALDDTETIGIETVKRKAQIEFNLLGQDFTLNGITQLRKHYPQLQGKGIKLSIKEALMDTVDVDIQNRYQPSKLASKILNPHASAMATIIGGAGNNYHSGYGVAKQLTYSSASYDSLQPNAIAILKEEATAIQNHSYGVGVENYYGADAQAYDQQVYNHPTTLHVFSAGNSGDKTTTVGTYANISKASNLTGNFKLAKNVLTVGATDSFNVLENRSSRGPAFDGRVKPDVVAFGQDGSSGAAALVSGLSALCYELYQSKNNQLPKAALIRNAIICGAEKIEQNPISFKSGYGAVNALKTIAIINNKQYIEDSLKHLQTKSYSFTLPNNLKSAKFTLLWHDTDAIILNQKALVNNLELELIQLSSNTAFLPWVLNAYANSDSLQLPATRKKDTLNNIEQISIDLPSAGNYQLKVRGQKVASKQQAFSITYSYDTLGQFVFQYPNKTDQFLPNEKQLLRWQSHLNDTIAQLYISYDLGINWILAKDSLYLKKQACYFNTKDTNCLLLLKMITSSGTFYSDTIKQIEIVKPKVQYICGDSALIAWPKVRNSMQYVVSNLDVRYLKNYRVLNDTFTLINSQNQALNQITIAPVLNNRECYNSNLYNYKNQGISCYVSNFLASVLFTNTANVQLELSSLFNVKKIRIEKKIGGQFSAIYESDVSNNLVFNVIDNHLNEGINTYRAFITLNNNQTVSTTESEILYLSESPFIMFPNPLTKETTLNIWNLNEDKFYVNIYNALGKIIFAKAYVNIYNQLSDLKLKPGIYFIEIENDTKRITKKKLIVI